MKISAQRMGGGEGALIWYFGLGGERLFEGGRLFEEIRYYNLIGCDPVAKAQTQFYFSPNEGELKEPTGFMSDPQKRRETIFNYKLTVKIYTVNSVLRRTSLRPALSARLIESKIKGVKKGRANFIGVRFTKLSVRVKSQKSCLWESRAKKGGFYLAFFATRRTRAETAATQAGQL